jgi:acetyltransferase-like isoleucine patch superfamily enzyme
MAIHPTALIADGAKLGTNVSIGPFTMVHANVVIGDDSVIEAYCEIGHPTPFAEGRPLVIGRGALIRSHSIFYEGSTLGDRMQTGHRVTVREKTTTGTNPQIGTLAEIQGDCEIGDFFRSQSHVFVAKGTRIGSFVWLLPYVVLTNDPNPPSDLCLGCHIGDYAAIAANSVILPGVKVGAHAVVGAQSLVTRDVEPGALVVGNPARFVKPAAEVRLRDGSGRAAYPWPQHFSRCYPADAGLD